MKEKKPFFLIPGAQKCGTSTLYELLVQHPECYMPEVKEPHSLVDEEFRMKDYLSLFKAGITNDNCKVIGEASTSYLVVPDLPVKARRELGSDVKLIFIFRDPVKRTLSAYLHLYKRGHELRDWNSVFADLQCGKAQDVIDRELNEGLKAETAGLICTAPYKERYNKYYMWPFQYIFGSLYSSHIERYLEVFSRKQCHFMFLENLMTDPNGEMERVFRFLEIDPSFSPRGLSEVWNKTVLKKPCSDLQVSVKKELRKLFVHENVRLENTIGEKLPEPWFKTEDV